jgi:hypothetical protein
MTRARVIRVPVVPTDFGRICKLCWKRPDKRDRTINGYHIECAKQASSIINDLMHGKSGIVYEEWYRKRWPGRPVPGIPIPGFERSESE